MASSTIRRAGVLAAFAVAVFAAAVLLLPGTAQASDTRPAKSEVLFSGVSLAEATPAGVTYDPATATLTLNNYKGGPIKVWPSDFRTVNITIVLEGDNVITAAGVKDDLYGSMGICSSFSDSCVTVMSSKSGKLAINSVWPGTGFGTAGIWAGGDITIAGDATVDISLKSTRSASMNRAEGIHSSSGMIMVKESASVSIVADISSANAACGFGVGADYPLVCMTTGYVNVDLSGVKGCTTYGIEVQRTPESSVLDFSWTPSVVFKADFVRHGVQSGSAEDQNPRTDSHYRLHDLGDSSMTYLLMEPWARLAGLNRYHTMALAAQVGWTHSEWAVIATGKNFPDALVAASLAGLHGSPIILTAPDKLSPEARAELLRLGVSKAYIVGGTSAVSAGVESQIKGLGGGIATTRVSGANRQETSAKALQQLKKGGASYSMAVVATGQGFADTLSIGPWCFASTSPILLAGKDGKLSADQVKLVKADKSIHDIVIVGGTAAVSNDVKKQLGGGYTYLRLGGANRYETSALIANWELASNQGMGVSSATVATGQNFPDALSGSALAGSKNSVMLLVKSAPVNTYAPETIIKDGYEKQVYHGFVLGGEAAVSKGVHGFLRALTAVG